MRFPFRAVGFLGLVALFGCGGSGGGGSASPIDPVAPTEKGTAKFSVDVATGKVAITPLETGSTKSAVLGGSAVTFETTTLLAEGGEVGRRAVRVRLKNNLQEAIGVGRPVRLHFGVFGPTTSYATDLRSNTTVSSPIYDPAGGFQDGPAGSALISNPNAIAVGKDGSIYFNGIDNRIRKLTDGYVSTVAQNVPATGLAYLTDALTGREFLIAACPTLHSVKLIPVASGSVTTWAGADNAAGNVNGAATTARFNTPSGVGIDPSQNQVLVADTANGAIRAIPFSFVGGNLVAGSVSSRYSGLTGPKSVTVSENRSVAVAETSANRIRVYNAGSSREAIFGGTSGNVNGDGNLARFSLPNAITALGNTFYVVDSGNYQVRRIVAKEGAAPLLAANWAVSVVAGSGTTGFGDGSGLVANFGNPLGIVPDSQGRLVVADHGANAIRRVVSEGSFDFGTPTGSSVGQANLTNPTGFVDLNGLQRPYIDLAGRVEPGQTVEAGKWIFSIPEGLSSFNFSVTVEASPENYAGLEAVLNPGGGAGSPNVVAQYLSNFGIVGSVDGRVESAAFDTSWGQTSVDANGNRFTADGYMYTVRRISRDGRVSLVAGKLFASGSTNGSGAVASFTGVSGIQVNPEGTEVIVVENFSQTVRRIALSNPAADPTVAENWQVSTIAGQYGIVGSQNGNGDIARFSSPISVAGPSNNQLYVVEFGGHRLRSVRYAGGPRDQASSWTVSVAAGSSISEAGFVDSDGTSARFNNPIAVSYSPSGTLYIADRSNSRIRAFNPGTGAVTTVAGDGTFGANDSTDALSARLGSVNGIAADASGAVYFTDGARIRRLYDGAVKTVAGGGDSSGRSGDKVNFGSTIYGLALDPTGDLYFTSNGRLVRLTRKLGR
jgi:sugar lactone lactonase YvrE